LNLSEGILLQALLPSAQSFQSAEGLSASPANLQLKPMMAMGVVLSIFLQRIALEVAQKNG
jgi:hypothetical protein